MYSNQKAVYKTRGSLEWFLSFKFLFVLLVLTAILQINSKLDCDNRAWYKAVGGEVQAFCEANYFMDPCCVCALASAASH